ncbi:MAG: purine-binding chemotaxis protein CheW [Burkholderiales bacterium]|nr:purine-binding chemotaxis protein CheW [Burkholderiales bacterium]
MMASLLLVFYLADFCYALKLDQVERVIHAVEITPLPGSLFVIEGLIDLAGEIVPVINMRKRFGLKERRVALTDRIIIAQAGRRVGLLVDAVGEVLPQADFVPAKDLSPDLDYLEGAMHRDDKVIVIASLERFLSREESDNLEEALCHAHS